MIEINPKSRQGNTFGKNDFFGNTIVIHDQCFKMLKICYEIRIPSKQKKWKKVSLRKSRDDNSFFYKITAF